MVKMAPHMLLYLMNLDKLGDVITYNFDYIHGNIMNVNNEEYYKEL